MDARDEAIVNELPQGLRVITVLNKSDLVGHHVPPDGAFAVSAKTGEGIGALRAALLDAAGWQPGGEDVFMARERHLRGLVLADTHLARAADEQGRHELMAEELRLAQSELSSITGEFTADDLLGEIFSRFCIGK
jgi:tRNA modification GTPase